MKCPNCNSFINFIEEIPKSTQTKLSDKKWYKLKEEPSLSFPTCKIKLKLKASKETKTKLVAIILIYITLTLVAYFYSTVTFIIMALFSAILSTPLINYVIHKYGELIEGNT